MKKVILIKYGEIALRGKNRFLFENQILNRIRQYFPGLLVKKEQGRILLEAREGDLQYEEYIPKLSLIMGIVGICPCIMFQDNSLEAINEMALAYCKENYGQNDGERYGLKVFAKRANKRYPYTSNDIAAEVGGYLLENMESFHVNLKNPDIKLFVELRNQVYIYSKTIEGLGGLPAGTSGKGLLLLSGGFDSPVAGFLMAKRGVDISAVYFHAPPFTSEWAKQKVIDLAERLSAFGGQVKLSIFPFTEIQLFLKEHVQEEKLTILLKRSMLHIADRLARKAGCQCLITGDSVGQVASQTLKSIEACSSAASLPVLRPLAGMDKSEIMALAEKIGTYEISKRPYDDCCTLFVAKHPETKPKANIIENIERKHWDELSKLMDEGIAKIEEINLSSSS